MPVRRTGLSARVYRESVPGPDLPSDLDGRHAHDFLRFRHDELGDIGRVQRQQHFTQAVLRKYLTPMNLLKTPELLAVAKENLETNLTNEELLKLVALGKDLDRERVQLTMVPGAAQSVDGVSYWLADEDGTRRWLHTGDLGYMDADGFVFIVDRKKDLIKTSGYQVWPREIEEALAAHPAVAEVGVAGVPDDVKGEAVRAWVVRRSGHDVTEADLRAHCRQLLAPYKVPGRIEFRETLPKTMVGKVLRRALRDDLQPHA